MLRLQLPVFIAIAALGACHSSPKQPTGSLELEISGAGVEIDTIEYEIRDASDVIHFAGNIDVSAPGATASLEVFGIPQGGGYQVILRAQSVDGLITCQGSATFSILAGQVTSVVVIIRCGDSERYGSVRVNGEFNRCAELRSMTVAPIEVAVGYTMDLSATAADAEADPVQFLWTATGGTIADPTSPSTTYECQTAGSHAITAAVSDDGFAYCSDSWTVAVTCASIGFCGDGVIEPQEACDPPDGVFCDATCQLIDPCADPNLCDDSNDCTVDVCGVDPSDNTAICDSSSFEPDGTVCDDGFSGVCLSGACVEVPGTMAKEVSVVCSNNVTGTLHELPYELSVTPLGPILDGVPVDLSVSGTAVFPAIFLNAAITTIPGLTEVTLNALTATPHLRAGALPAGDLTTLSSASPLPSSQPIPLINDEPTCTNAGLQTPCALEPLLLPLSSSVVTFTPDGSGDVLLGWNEDLLPPIPVVAANPPGPNGTRVLAIVLSVGLECYMGRVNDNGTPNNTGDDFAEPLPNAALLAVPLN